MLKKRAKKVVSKKVSKVSKSTKEVYTAKNGRKYIYAENAYGYRVPRFVSNNYPAKSNAVKKTKVAKKRGAKGGSFWGSLTGFLAPIASTLIEKGITTGLSKIVGKGLNTGVTRGGEIQLNTTGENAIQKLLSKHGVNDPNHQMAYINEVNNELKKN